MKKENVVADKALEFAVRIVNLGKYLRLEHKEYILSKQIVRSGTSIGANVTESQGGISKNEFSQKLSIAYKECKEAQYWLLLLFRTKYLSDEQYDSLNADAQELGKILFSILKATGRIQE